MTYRVGQILYRAFVNESYVRYDEHSVTKVTTDGGWVVQKILREDERTHEELWEFNRNWLKWVPEDGRFCSKTKHRALERLRARTESYVKHCKRRLSEAEHRARVLSTDVKELPPLRTLDGDEGIWGIRSFYSQWR